MKGKCSLCGTTIEGRRSTKNSAQANFLRNLNKHQWKNHRNAMIRRIKAGKQLANHNPSWQDFATALQSGVRDAITIYKTWTEAQYQLMKRFMDAFEVILPPAVVISWKAIEAYHDATKN